MEQYSVIVFGTDENPNGWTLLATVQSLESSAQKFAARHEEKTNQPAKVVEVSEFLRYAKTLVRLEENWR